MLLSTDWRNKYKNLYSYLETRDSNPYYLDPKPSALPIKLVSINKPYKGNVRWVVKVNLLL